MMLIGDSVQGGLHGTPPDLTDLDDRGDLKARVQFQQTYASVLEQHLGVDSAPILQGEVEAVPNLIEVPATEGVEVQAASSGHLPQ